MDTFLSTPSSVAAMGVTDGEVGVKRAWRNSSDNGTRDELAPATDKRARRHDPTTSTPDDYCATGDTQQLGAGANRASSTDATPDGDA